MQCGVVQCSAVQRASRAVVVARRVEVQLGKARSPPIFRHKRIPHRVKHLGRDARSVVDVVAHAPGTGASSSLVLLRVRRANLALAELEILQLGFGLTALTLS